MSNASASHEPYPTPSFHRLDRQQLELIRTKAKAEMSRGPAKPCYARHVEFVMAQAEHEQERRERIGHYEEPMPAAEFIAGLMAL